MSTPLRGRGAPSRGRGVGRSSLSRQLSSDEEGDASMSFKQEDEAAAAEDGQDDDTSMRPPSRSASVASSSATGSSAAGVRASLINRQGPASSATPSATPGGTLLRKNVYTKGTKMKFMPNMVRRKAPAEYA